ncbi:dTDP-4-dehydrorhamnose 3,5-epimerase family protein [Alphaproteobacteria bacterium]|nr:dTDP-4-dehydrorhamnose 3,5-epimerase family protein [Alphaproteobacteria bacterium]
MIIEDKTISGLYLIKYNIFRDNRGVFSKFYSNELFKKNNINFQIKQVNLSVNPKKYTLRGFHYQRNKNSEYKIIQCLSGSIYNVVLDIRKNSPTYKKWKSFKLTNSKNFSLLIPKGCANAWLTTNANTTLLYFHSKNYLPKQDLGIRFNDPFFKVKWPHQPKVISQKDSSYTDYK